MATRRKGGLLLGVAGVAVVGALAYGTLSSGGSTVKVADPGGGSMAAPSFCPTNLATGSATPPSTAMAIMPTRSFPSGAISKAADVCPNVTSDNPTSNAAINRSRLIC